MAPSRTWVLTGSPEHYEATAHHGFSLVGLKEGRRSLALQIEPGDRTVLHVTGRMAFAASIVVTGGMFEDRTPVWPGKPGKVDPCPWRFPTEPELVPDEAGWVPAEELAGKGEHVRKWPAEHWKLALQGQIRAVSEHDADLLLERMRAGARAPA